MSSSPEHEKPQYDKTTRQGRKPNFVTQFLDYKLYPRAHEANLSIHDPGVRTSRLALARAAAKNFVLLQALFFALFCYIFGALYKQNNRINHLNVAFVDYDGGSIGGAIRAAYQSLKSNRFPSMIEYPRESYPNPSDLREDVCRISYWGAFYIAPGASQLLEQALASNNANYNKSAIMQYIWNEARYSALIDQGISSNLQMLSNMAKPIWARNTNWTDIIPSADENTFTTFANPWILASDNLQPTVQGTRLVYNTLVVILLMIQEFFYLGSLNQLYDMFKIYTKISPHRIIFFRLAISLCYCLIGSLCIAGTIWIFKQGWQVNGNQFVLTWMILWLFAHLNFLTLDVFTVWLPPPFVPMALVAWLVLNVTSILLPFELMPTFYLWAYAMPAHELYVTLVDIWSRGCNPVLRYSLPILFSYEVSSFILAGIGIHRRCHYAILRQEAEQNTFKERLEAGLALEKKNRAEDRARFEADMERLAKEKAECTDESEIKREEAEESQKEDAQEDAENRKDIEELIAADQRRVERLGSYNFGPSFGFGLTAGNVGKEDDGGEIGRSRTYGGRRTFRRKGSMV